MTLTLTLNLTMTMTMTLTSGIFLYVALVDMMPELNSGHSHPLSKETQPEGHFSPIILQVHYGVY